MKKLICALVLFFFSASPSSALSSVQYGAENFDAYAYFDTPAITGFAESFSGHVQLSSVSWYLQRDNNPTGQMVAKVYKASNGFPVGSPLAVSKPIDVSSVSTTGFGFYAFNFPKKLNLKGEYAVSLEYPGGNWPDKIRVGYDSTPTFSGVGSRFETPTQAWHVYTPQDFIFSIQ
jgi:hypothetical protein